MKQDLFAIGSGFLAVGVFIWAVWGNPEMPSRHAAQQINADHDLKLVSEQSPYMRNER
jgi:hypothetical protein